MRKIELKSIVMSLFALCSSSAMAQVIYVSGSVVTIPVDETYGSTIELPSSVHIVTPPKFVKVEPLSDQAAVKNDVRIFQVYPSNLKNHPDKMNFLLWNGKNISVRFIESEFTDDNFYQIKFQGSVDHNQPRFASNSKFFLSDEKNLILKMLKDDGGTDRKIVNTASKIEKFPDLDVKLVRIFKQDSLIGYVFTVKNTSSKKIELNLASLTIGVPNHIEMLQTDQEELNAGSVTALRIVTKDASDFDPGSSGLGTEKAPFNVVKNGGES